MVKPAAQGRKGGADRARPARHGFQTPQASSGPPVLVIVGPTAVGKTSLSLHLARRLDGEIVSADSRLFYRQLDIGTAKPTREQRREIPHHLIDIRNPGEPVTLGEYQELAYSVIEQIQERGKLPIIVGGSGQYIKAVVEGWGIPRVAPNPQLRRALAALSSGERKRWLTCLDPRTADRIDFRNTRRVVRALEVTLASGIPLSVQQTRRPPALTFHLIGLYLSRDNLYAHIDARVEQMMAAGLLDEVKTLRATGIKRNAPSARALGYAQLWAHLEGELTLAEAVERIKYDTHRFARQQSTWFRRDDTSITWFDAADAGLSQHVFDHVAGRLPADQSRDVAP